MITAVTIRAKDGMIAKDVTAFWDGSGILWRVVMFVIVAMKSNDHPSQAR